MSYSRTLIVGLCAALLLAACGGSGSQNITGQGPPVRGTLLKNPPDKVTVLTAANLLLALNASPNQQLAALVATPVCDVAVYHIEYQTVGGASEATTASGALMVPLGLDAKCSGGGRS